VPRASPETAVTRTCIPFSDADRDALMALEVEADLRVLNALLILFFQPKLSWPHEPPSILPLF
jgi:hypothetical protein